MNQTLAIFVDAYRELNAKKMFWITMILSALFMGAFALLGVNSKGFSILWWQIPLGNDFAATDFYRLVFTNLGIGLWLTRIAAVLALVSTAFIFPDFLTGGSIDLYLCKPIGRLRLFLTKYLAGLLFVALQVLAFSVASFLVLGIRGGIWAPSVFLAIPIVVCFFSYLFSISVLFGVMTRSTIAAVLFVFLFWAFIWATHTAETLLLTWKIGMEQQSSSVERRIKAVDAEVAAAGPKTQAAEDSRTQFLKSRRTMLEEQQANLELGLPKVRFAYNVAYGIKTVVPKTADTVDLLDRWLLPVDPMIGKRPRRFGPGGAADPMSSEDLLETRTAYETEVRTRPLWWVVGTSLTFEAAVLALAAWIFCRRDY
jgi:ABC-type transport system involved in multi-copper enzyme maturation permease subunit